MRRFCLIKDQHSIYLINDNRITIIMNRAKFTYFVDVLLLLAFILAGLTGVVMFFLTGKQLAILGGKQLWSSIHDWSGLAMVALALLHTILYWRVMMAKTRAYFLPKKKVKKD